MNLQYFLFVYVPSVQNFFYFNEIYNTIRNGTIVRNLPQILICVTLSMIIGINGFDSVIGLGAFLLSIFIIPFNIVQNCVFITA